MRIPRRGRGRAYPVTTSCEPLRVQNDDGTESPAGSAVPRRDRTEPSASLPLQRRPEPPRRGAERAGEPLNNRHRSNPSARAKRAIDAPVEAHASPGKGEVLLSPGRRTDDANHTRSGRLSSAISVADSCQLGNSWARAPTKVVPSCDKRWVGARNLRSTDHRIGTPIPQGTFRKEREPPEVKHSSRGRTRNQQRCRE